MKTSKPLVSIIIVSWNSSKYIVPCLRSIHDFTSQVAYEIIVVDNASSDGTAETILNDFPEVRLIEAGGNLGFPRANNLGILSAEGDYLLLLNPDACFKSDVLGALLGFMQADPAVGATAPKILEKDGTISPFTIRELPSLLNFFFTEFGFRKAFPNSKIFVRGGQLEWDGKSPRNVSFISGAAVMIPKAVIMDTGPLDERLPMYFEDLDMSARIRQAGRQLYVVPSAVVLHVGARSAEMSPVRSLLLALEDGQAPWLYMKTYRSDGHAAAFTLIILLANMLRLCVTVPLYACGLFSNACASTARWQRKRSIALLRWSVSNKSKFADRFAHIFSTG